MTWSRTTLMSLWLLLTLGVATWGWCETHPDECAQYLSGDGTLTPTQEVPLGRTSVSVPCDVWLPRQRPAVQAAVVLDGILFVVFCFSVWADVRRRAEQRGRL